MANQAETIRALIQDDSDEQASWRPDSDSWSVLEVINHLYDEEREDFRHLGLTLIRKRTGRAPKNARVALVLAGGAVTGGAFKVGGLQALDDFLVGRRVNELDIYVGLSAGSVLAVPKCWSSYSIR